MDRKDSVSVMALRPESTFRLMSEVQHTLTYKTLHSSGSLLRQSLDLIDTTEESRNLFVMLDDFTGE